MLCSTTGLYGRPVIEVAYGEMILSLYQDCVEDDSSRRMVGVSASPMLDIPESTPVWAQYILFSGFQDIKTYIYMYNVFKTYMQYKRILVVSDLVLARRGSEDDFDRP